MAQYRDFYDHINTFLPGVARPVVLPVLRQVLIKFCENTRIWRVTLESVPVHESSIYDLNELSGDEFTALEASMIDVLSVELDGKPVDKAHYRKVARRGIAFIDSIRLPQTGTLTFNVSLKPTAESDELPDHLLSDWYAEISIGVAGRMMMQPSKSWSDVKLGLHYQNEYIAGESKARFEANNDKNHIPVAVKNSFW